MTVARAITELTLEQYLELEERAEVRHEFVDGFIYATAGETERHNIVVRNIFAALRGLARVKDCRVLVESVKLHVSAKNRVYYPDIMVLCDPSDDEPRVKRRPCFIAEVLSPSTEMTDKREKLEAYKTLESLQTYMIVIPDERSVKVFQRGVKGWAGVSLEGQAEIDVPCLESVLTLEQGYEGT